MRVDKEEFLYAWFFILLINQVFLFGACFYPSCIIAALPHTGIIAYFLVRKPKKKKEDTTNTNSDLSLDINNTFTKDFTNILNNLDKEKTDTKVETNSFRKFESKNETRTFGRRVNRQNKYKSSQKQNMGV